MIPFVLVTVFFLAAGLMVFGLRGRQAGDKPRCQECLYDLSGSSEICPECGTAFSLHTTTRGLKKTRFVFVAGGLLLFAGEIAFLNATYDRARWLRHFPYSILLAHSKNGRWTMYCSRK